MTVCLLSISWILKAIDVKKIPDKVNEMKLDMYNKPDVFYKSGEQIYGPKYKVVAENAGGRVTEVKDSSVSAGNNPYIYHC